MKFYKEKMNEMKKSIFTAASAILLCAATSVLAAGIIASNDGSIIEKSVDKAEMLDSADTKITVEKQTSSNDFNELAECIGYDTYDKFEVLHKLLIFMGKYCKTERQYETVKAMVLDGCDVQTVMNIYQFYLTTNEDVSIIRDIYDITWNGEETINNFMIESAFNAITNNKCGVLSEDDVINYMENGISIEDIERANVLSRRGIMTIQEILNEVENNVSWGEILEKISGEKISSYEDTGAENLINAAYIAKVFDGKISDVLDGEYEENFDAVVQKVNAAMKEKGIWKAKPTENTEQIIKEAQDKGIKRETVEKLLDMGYNESDIINSLYEENVGEGNILGIVKKEAAE